MKLSALLAPLLDAKVDHELIRQQIAAYEQQQADALEHRRQVDADRQARKRERDKSRDVTLRHSDRSLTGDRVAPVEDKPLTTDTEPQDKKQNTAARGVSEFKAKLSPLLDADLLDAFVAVRKAKRGALTGYAAGIFVNDAERCGMSVPEAATECVRSSWITVKPEYFSGRPRAGPAQSAPSIADVFAHAGSRVTSHEDQPGPQEDRLGVRASVPYLSAVRSG